MSSQSSGRSARKTSTSVGPAIVAIYIVVISLVILIVGLALNFSAEPANVHHERVTNQNTTRSKAATNGRNGSSQRPPHVDDTLVTPNLTSRHPHDVSSHQHGAPQLIKESPSQESLVKGQQLTVERSKVRASNWRCSVDGKQLIVKTEKSNNWWRGWLEWYPCFAIWIGICTYCNGRSADLLPTFPFTPAKSVALGNDGTGAVAQWLCGSGVVAYVADFLPQILSGITKLVAMLLLKVWATYLVCDFITCLHHTLHGFADSVWHYNKDLDLFRRRCRPTGILSQEVPISHYVMPKGWINCELMMTKAYMAQVPKKSDIQRNAQEIVDVWLQSDLTGGRAAGSAASTAAALIAKPRLGGGYWHKWLQRDPSIVNATAIVKLHLFSSICHNLCGELGSQSWPDGSGGRSLAGQDWNILLESESDTAHNARLIYSLCATVRLLIEEFKQAPELTGMVCEMLTEFGDVELLQAKRTALAAMPLAAMSFDDRAAALAAMPSKIKAAALPLMTSQNRAVALEVMSSQDRIERKKHALGMIAETVCRKAKGEQVCVVQCWALLMVWRDAQLLHETKPLQYFELSSSFSKQNSNILLMFPLFCLVPHTRNLFDQANTKSKDMETCTLDRVIAKDKYNTLFVRMFVKCWPLLQAVSGEDDINGADASSGGEANSGQEESYSSVVYMNNDFKEIMCRGISGQTGGASRHRELGPYRQTSAKWEQIAFAILSISLWLALSVGCFYILVGLVEGHNSYLHASVSWNLSVYNRYLKSYDDALQHGEEALDTICTWAEGNLLAFIISLSWVAKQFGLVPRSFSKQLGKFLFHMPCQNCYQKITTLLRGDLLQPAMRGKPSYSKCIRPLHCFQEHCGVKIDQLPPILVSDIFPAGAESLYALIQTGAEELRIPQLKKRNRQGTLAEMSVDDQTKCYISKHFQIAEAIEIALGKGLSSGAHGGRGLVAHGSRACSQHWAMLVPTYYKYMHHLALVIFNDSDWQALKKMTQKRQSSEEDAEATKKQQSRGILGLGAFQNDAGMLRDSLHAAPGVVRKRINECFQQDMYFKVFLPCCSERGFCEPTSRDAQTSMPSYPTTPLASPQGSFAEDSGFDLGSKHNCKYNVSGQRKVKRVQATLKDLGSEVLNLVPSDDTAAAALRGADGDEDQAAKVLLNSPDKAGWLRRGESGLAVGASVLFREGSEDVRTPAAPAENEDIGLCGTDSDDE